MQICVTKFPPICAKKPEIFNVLKNYAFLGPTFYPMGFKKQSMFLLISFLPLTYKFCFFREHHSLTKGKLYKFLNFENRPFLNQI